jgi:hypothetical protein
MLLKAAIVRVFLVNSNEKNADFCEFWLATERCFALEMPGAL